MGQVTATQPRAAVQASLYDQIYSFLRTLYHTGAWRRGNLACLVAQKSNRSKNLENGYSDDDHLRAAANWLERAQDATPDGGVSGRYHLRRGWTSSYPETTGYIVPTLIKLATSLDDRFSERAERSTNFLLGVQLNSGAFPGGEIADNSHVPSPFNTGQIIHGLVEWYKHTNEDRALTAAIRAGDWLVSVQSEDGAFAKHFYLETPATYSAHLSCWLAQLGDETGERRFLQSAERHLVWLLHNYVPESGWIDLAGFTQAQHRDRVAYTHTIAYTLAGVLHSSTSLGSREGIDAVVNAASQILRRAEISQRLPGLLDWKWRSQSNFSCLTGNAQMAIIWFRLFEMLGDARFLNVGIKALDWVKRAQSMDNQNPGIRGGIPGSDPIWGDYIQHALPNWAAKYFIDGLLRKREVLAQTWEPAKLQTADDIPTSVPVVKSKGSSSLPKPLCVAMLTTSSSSKVPQMVEAWSDSNFRPNVVFILETPAPGLKAKICDYVNEFGLGALAARIFLRKKHGPIQSISQSSSRSFPSVREYCRSHGINAIDLRSLDSEEGLQQISELQPDLMVCAGGGILRQPVLSIPRLGTLNSHMGILPHYRGMNVTEWAATNGHAVGCSVHLVDAGIDTGDILCIRQVTVDAPSVAGLRAAVDKAQIELLGEVLGYIAETGELPPRHPQQAHDGKQFYRMHSELIELLQRRLHSAYHASGEEPSPTAPESHT